MDNGKIMLVFVETGQKRKSVSGYMSAYKETRKKELMIIERLSISPKGEITIPKELLIMLGFKDSAECIVYNDKLVIRPFLDDRADAFAEFMHGVDHLRENPFIPVSQEQVFSDLSESRRQIMAGQGIDMEEALNRMGRQFIAYGSICVS